MGWDSVQYKGRYEQFNDFDLWTLRHFFVEEAKAVEIAERSQDAIQMREFFEKWEWLGPGVVTNTDFSEFVLDSRSRWQLLLRLLQQTGDRIASFGDLIPLDYLTSHISTRTAHFTKAQPVRPYLVSIGRICTLLSHSEPSAP